MAKITYKEHQQTLRRAPEILASGVAVENFDRD